MTALEPYSSDRFEILAQEVWDALPEQFREVAGNLSIQVAEFAGTDTLHGLNIASPYGLLGLYHGIGLPFKTTGDLPYGPDMIFLYRQPILAFASERGEAVPDVIRHVLIHEIGHHFGYSDEDMDAIEAGEG